MQLLGMSSDEGVIDLTDGIPPYKRQRLDAGKLKVKLVRKF